MKSTTGITLDLELSNRNTLESQRSPISPTGIMGDAELGTISRKLFIKRPEVRIFILLANVERMHPYQRGRMSITGLMVELLKSIETGRLVGVAWRGLFSGLILFGDSGSDCQR